MPQQERRRTSSDLDPHVTILGTRELLLKQAVQLGGVLPIQVEALADFAGDGAVGRAVCLEEEVGRAIDLDPRVAAFRGRASE